jgi:hypothetical protein
MDYTVVLIIFITILLTIIILKFSHYKKTKTKEEIKRIYEEINSSKEFDRKTINQISLPLVTDEKKYIELQTKEWINQREKNGYCYGLLEKDKIVMTKWMLKYNIKAPKIHYYDYYNNFTFDKLRNVVITNPETRFVIKISHLQSNYGIIIIEPLVDKKDIKYLEEIYKKCQEKFKTCFVCNHDENNAPKNDQIKNGEKQSYYKLYETIEPGIIIQEFFYSDEKNIKTQPKEIKVLVYGNKIIGAKLYGDTMEEIYNTPYTYKRIKPVYDMARNISKLLGSSLIRVDMFIKETDDPFEPYFNEISLSPNGGFKNNTLDSTEIEKLKKEIGNYEPIEMEIDELIKSAPTRTLPIGKYLSDSEWGTWWSEKYKFGLLGLGN